MSPLHWLPRERKKQREMEKNKKWTVREGKRIITVANAGVNLKRIWPSQVSTLNDEEEEEDANFTFSQIDRLLYENLCE